MQVQSPAEAVLVWLSQQPPAIQDEIAFLVLCHAPGVDVDRIWQLNQREYLREWLSPPESSPPEIASRLLCFRSLFEFWLDSRGTREGWERTMHRTARIAQSFDQSDNPESAGIARDLLDGFEFRQALWVRTYQSWCEFEQANLGSAAIQQWLDRAWRSSLPRG